KIIKTTATAFTDYFTTRSRAAIFGPVKPTCIAWLRPATTSSTNALHRACRLPANMAGYWPIVPSAAPKCRVHSMHADRPVSSFCSAVIKPFADKSRPARSRCFRKRTCCIPVGGEYQSKLTLMSESLRNDGRVWVPKRKEDRNKAPGEIPETDRDYYLERKYPSYGNLSPRDISSRAAKEVCDEGRGVGPG